MTARRSAALLALVLSLGGAPAWSRDLTAAEKTALTARVDSFNAAMRDHKVDTIIDVVPPRVLDIIAKNGNLDPARVRQALAEQTGKLMEAGVIKSFSMKPADAHYEALKDGTPYALLPTATTVEMNGQKLESKIDTLAMMDGGKWYLLDLSKTPQVALFMQAYPEFSGVSFGSKSIKAVP